jgi:hypothetical protein
MLQGLDERTANINLQLASLAPKIPAPASSCTHFVFEDRTLPTETSHDTHNVPEGPSLGTDILLFFHHSKQLLEQLISDTRAARTGQRMENLRMEDGGKLLAGTINTQGKQEISQGIKDVSAVRGGRGIVGVAENVNIKDFFQLIVVYD